MNESPFISFRTGLLFAAIFLAVFWESAFNGIRNSLGVQIDLLPALMIYAGLRASPAAVPLSAALGGLWLDSLSSGPLGASVLPLLIVGAAVRFNRGVILQDEMVAQFVLGLGASLAVPVMMLLYLLSTGHTPLFGWGTLWQLIVMGLGGALATPILFILLNWTERNLTHGRAVETSFRADREIRRGR